MKSEDATSKLRKINSYLKFMDPPKFVTDMGPAFAESLINICKTNVAENIHIALGYHNSDLTPEVGYLCMDDSELYVFFNLYATEFIMDYYAYLKNEDDVAFRYLYCKQMRNAEYNANNYEAAAIYNWIYSEAKKQVDSNNSDMMLKAFAISAFLALHELAHRKQDSKDVAYSMMNEMMEELEAHGLGDLTDKEKTEILCDYIALLVFDSNGLDTLFGIKKEEMIGVSLGMMRLIFLYNNLPQFTMNKSGREIRIADIDEITRRILTVYFLMKKTQNRPGNLFDCNLEEAIRIATKSTEFASKIMEFYRNDWSNEVEKFIGLSDDEKAKYYLSKNENVWIYYV